MEATCAMSLERSPSVVVWEVSRACDLACLHCRASIQAKRSTLELSTCEGYDLIEQVADLAPERFTLSGGDPLKRPDIFELIDAASRRRLNASLAVSATPLLSTEAIDRLRDAGLARLAIALEGSAPEAHDGVRGVPGAFRVTVDSIRHATAIGLPVEVNTIVSRFNLSQIDAMMAMMGELGVASWNLHFYVPCGPGSASDMISAEDMERVFARLYEGGRHAPFEIRTTEAMHYRRYVLQRELRENPDLARRVFEAGFDYAALVEAMKQDSNEDADAFRSAHPLLRVNDARGFLFVSHIGEVYPSGFLPLSGGNVRFRKLAHIYRNSPLFTTIRDSAELGGKCGLCEFKDVCGGSRARAYAVNGDPMAAEPSCAYQPAVLREDSLVGH
jgi:radical SAM protein